MLKDIYKFLRFPHSPPVAVVIMMNINWSSSSDDEILDSENEVYEEEEDWLGIYSEGKDEEIEDEEEAIGIGNKEEDDEVRDKEKHNRVSEIVKAHNEGIMEWIDMMQKLGTEKTGKTRRK